jgi:hypothetical protein
MRRWSSRPVMAVAAMVLVWLCSAAIATGQQPQMSDEAFKNVQALKGIPVDEFMGTMGLFSAALSMCCGDCHTGAGTSNPKWEADPPRKRTARRMVQMVDVINKANFNGRRVVTCWTCHRGQPRPAATPPMDRIYGEPVNEPADILPVASSAVPTIDQILDRYVAAMGGAKLSSITSLTAKGTSIGYGEVGKGDPAELYARAPNQLMTIVHQRDGDMSRVFDGQNGFFMLPLTIVQVYPWTDGAIQGAKLEAEMMFPDMIKSYLTDWRVSFPITLDGREVDVVQGTGPDNLLATLYFDKQSGLLNRLIHYRMSAVGRVPTQIDLADYKPVGGRMFPSKWSYAWVSGREEYTWTDAQANAAVDQTKFAKPVPRSR